MSEDKERLILSVTADQKRDIRVAAANAHQSVSAWVAGQAKDATRRR